MEPIPADIPADLSLGYHLTFYTNWQDMYREDRRALTEKYGDVEAARDFYGGLGQDYLLQVYRDDLERAKVLGAKYIVFHVSDVSIKEGYTYRWRHTSLRTEQDGVTYAHRMLDAHDSLCRYIKGLHLHQSLSGSYVRDHTGTVPLDLPTDSMAQFGFSYQHILRIDRHQPWTAPEVASIVERLQPEYLTHKLSAGSSVTRRKAIAKQRKTLARGWTVAH